MGKKPFQYSILQLIGLILVLGFWMYFSWRYGFLGFSLVLPCLAGALLVLSAQYQNRHVVILAALGLVSVAPLIPSVALLDSQYHSESEYLGFLQLDVIDPVRRVISQPRRSFAVGSTVNDYPLGWDADGLCLEQATAIGSVGHGAARICLKWWSSKGASWAWPMPPRRGGIGAEWALDDVGSSMGLKGKQPSPERDVQRDGEPLK